MTRTTTVDELLQISIAVACPATETKSAGADQTNRTRANMNEATNFCLFGIRR
jgi:hypothetical protein